MIHLRALQFDFDLPGAGAVRRLVPATLARPQGVRRLGHLSDFHLGNPTFDDLPNAEAVCRWLDAFERADVDVLAVTGDLVEEPGDRRRLRRAKDLLERAPFPYVTIPGNHDVPHPGRSGPFEESFGDVPTAARHADVEFLLFDSMKGLPEDERSRMERRDARKTGSFSRGRVGDEQRREVDEQLGEPPRFGQVMLVHHHLRTNAPTPTGWQREPTAPHGLMAPLDDAAAHLAWTAQRARLALHGHKHRFWAPYRPLPELVVLNSGTSVQAKPDRARHARIVDIWPGMASLIVHDLVM